MFILFLTRFNVLPLSSFLYIASLALWNVENLSFILRLISMYKGVNIIFVFLGLACLIQGELFSLHAFPWNFYEHYFSAVQCSKIINICINCLILYFVNSPHFSHSSVQGHIIIFQCVPIMYKNVKNIVDWTRVLVLQWNILCVYFGLL